MAAGHHPSHPFEETFLAGYRFGDDRSTTGLAGAIEQAGRDGAQPWFPGLDGPGFKA